MIQSPESCCTRRPVRDARRLATRSALVILFAVLSLAAPGCDDDETAVLSDPCLGFSSEASAASGTVTTQLGDDSNCLAATLEIVAAGFDDVYSLETIVYYDPTMVAFQGHSIEGSVLASDGAALTSIATPTASGELTVGVSRVAEEDGVSIDASGDMLIKLLFSLNTTVAGSSDVTLDGNCLASSGEPPVTIDGVDCSGGTFRVE